MVPVARTAATAVALAVLVVSATACGGDDDTGAAATTVAVPTVEERSPWCTAARSVREAAAALDVIDLTDPVQVEGAITQLVERVDAAVAVAPPEIAADAEVSAATARRFATALAEVDHDFVEVDLSFLAEGSAAEADRRIDAYNVAECGFDPMTTGTAAPDGADDADGDGTAFDPAAGSIRDQAVALFVSQGFTEDEAGCLFDRFDLSDPETATDPEVIADIVEACGIDESRLAEIGSR